MHIAETLDRAARLWPNRTAAVQDDRRRTYLEFRERALRLADYFLGQGLEPGDRIAVIDCNSLEFMEIYYAAAYAGLILNPVNIRLAPRETAFILQDSAARLLLAGPDFADRLDETLNMPEGSVERIVWIGSGPDALAGRPAMDYEAALESAGNRMPPRSGGDDEVAHLYYTSGTTGRPKGVMLTHRNVVTHALGAVAELHLTDADVWAHVAPLFHLADAWAVFALTLAGGRHVVLPRFDPERVLDIIRREGVTLSNMIPTMLNMLINLPGAAQAEYPGLRCILSGGAPIAPEVVRRIMETFGCEYVQTYGMTETSPYLTLSLLKAHLRPLPPERRFWYQSRTGREFITVQLKVVRPDGTPVEPDDSEVGEIWVRGDSVTPGYWNRPEETAGAFRDGWLMTGDLAVIEPEGYVNIVDRKKDMIITGGENVYSTEVENVLYEHPAVLEAAVFGAPDPKWGETVRAVVALKPGERAGPDELIEFCRRRLAHYKAPRSIDFVPELPKTGSGKIYKKGLRDAFAAPALRPES
ncbi:MAG: long-chain-fatty-acid--CoA ligase [Proteobacteria bacterium]|nr:long-chain-fatty-acid--CoA ligase [Pseudomonadota bacterium]